LVEGSVPFIPWVSFFLFGMILSDLKLISPKISQKVKIIVFLLVGIIVLISWLLLISLISNLFFLTFFKAIGLFLIIFSFLHFYFDIKGRISIFSKRIIEWGELAFSLYYIQFGMILCLTILLNIKIIQVTSLQTLFIQFLISTSIILLFLEVFLIIWKKYEYKYGIEWFMSLFSYRSLFDKKDFYEQSNKLESNKLSD
jgi:hypothetical protein